MNALTYDRRDEGWEPYDEDDSQGGRMPGRPRRRYATRASAVLGAAVLLAIGFYAGVRLEKSQVGSSSSSGGSALASAFAARARALGSGSGAGAGAASGASGATVTPTAGGAAAGGTAAAAGGGRAGGAGLPFGAGGGGGGAPSFGTVSSVGGRTLFLSDTSGNTVKVKLPSSTKISKSLPVSRHSIHPGDTVVIQGVKNSSGTLVAASVTDSGSSSRSTGGSSSSSGSSGSSSSGVGSLFTPGGG
jgi:hypothetical protein